MNETGIAKGPLPHGSVGVKAPTFEELVDLVDQWAEDRGIYKHANPQAQLLKTMEELGEVASALAKGRQEELVDGVGDVLVTLILFAHMNGFDTVFALGEAYKEIHGRKGRMENGIFIKEETHASS